MTDQALAGQVAIVTGAGRGIGRAIAEALAGAGAAVSVAARTEAQLEETVRLISVTGGQASGVAADVTDAAAVERLVQQTERSLGPVDLLVNNAAVLGPVGPLWENDPEEWRRCLEVNLFGTFLCTRAVLPGMIGRHRGRVVNLVSGSPWPYVSAYGTTKTGLYQLSERLASEVKEYGISVFALMPGAVWTEMLESLAGTPQFAFIRERFAGRWLSPKLPAAQCVLLASGACDALSGCAFDPNDDLAALAARANEIRERQLHVLRRRALPLNVEA